MRKERERHVLKAVREVATPLNVVENSVRDETAVDRAQEPKTAVRGREKNKGEQQAPCPLKLKGKEVFRSRAETKGIHRRPGCNRNPTS